MKLALRKLPESDSLLHVVTAKMIKSRLVSQYCHGGIVIDGTLYHSTSAKGLHDVDKWNPSEWDLVELGSDRDDAALDLFCRYHGAGYDWVSLIAFAGLKVRDSSRMYCFEWCYFAMTGVQPRFRVTPEVLMSLRLAKYDTR
ncbi:MAG: hypothetical protein ACRC0J_01785 [Shewanella oncorhynchi]